MRIRVANKVMRRVLARRRYVKQYGLIAELIFDRERGSTEDRAIRKVCRTIHEKFKKDIERLERGEYTPEERAAEDALIGIMEFAKAHPEISAEQFSAALRRSNERQPA